MSEIELRPSGVKSMEEIIKERGKTKLPVIMHNLLKAMLIDFQFDDSHVVDVSRHILDADVDIALEDCVPMKAFFGLCANAYEEKEDKVAEAIKIMVGGGIIDSKERVAKQKGQVMQSLKYTALIKQRLRYQKLKKDCRVLEEAMQMRKEVAQTKSANYRGDMSGPFVTRNK